MEQLPSLAVGEEVIELAQVLEVVLEEQQVQQQRQQRKRKRRRIQVLVEELV